MPFKFDAISKVQNFLRKLYKENPSLYLYGDGSQVSYFNTLVPIIHKNLSDYEIEVLIDIMCLDISGTYNDKYYKIKKFYDSIILYKTNPLFVIGEYFDEIKGFSGISGKRQGDPED